MMVYGTAGCEVVDTCSDSVEVAGWKVEVVRRSRKEREAGRRMASLVK